MSRYIDAELIPYFQSENGCQDDFALRYDINEMPTADVELVRHGHWLKDEKHGLEKCSICNEIRHFDIYDDPDQVIYLPCNYCPNCGAKMDLPKIKLKGE